MANATPVTSRLATRIGARVLVRNVELDGTEGMEVAPIQLNVAGTADGFSKCNTTNLYVDVDVDVDVTCS